MKTPSCRFDAVMAERFIEYRRIIDMKTDRQRMAALDRMVAKSFKKFRTEKAG